jgi:copper chaperone CopZ
MKKIILMSLVLAGFATVSSGQVKVVQSKIKTPNALCEACKVRIESYLKRVDGIVYVDVNYRKGETTVKYQIDRMDIEQIKTGISNLGYDADDVPANEDSYKRLPKTCKKFEDGGGHPKPRTPATPSQPGQ